MVLADDGLQVSELGFPEHIYMFPLLALSGNDLNRPAGANNTGGDIGEDVVRRRRGERCVAQTDGGGPFGVWRRQPSLQQAGVT